MTRPNSVTPSLTESDIERFWSAVDKSGGQGPNGDCWEWRRGKRKGYGHFMADSRTLRAHRVAFLLARGHWPSELVLHHCDNPSCCRDEHLWVGSNLDNIEDRHRKKRDARGERSGRRTHPERTARGERVALAKSNEAQVRALRARYDGGDIDAKALAREFGLGHALVHRIVTRRSWKHVE